MAPTHPLHACIRSGDVSLVSSRVGSVSQSVISRPPRIPHTFQICDFAGMIHDSGTRTDDDFLKEPHKSTLLEAHALPRHLILRALPRPSIHRINCSHFHLTPTMRQLLFALVCAPAAALVATRLQTVQVTRASDARPIALSSLWTEDERAVLVFLRHFG
jgi:hypothetical protein